MHPALFKLIVLSIKSGFRRTFRGAKTLKGIFLIVFAMAVTAMMIAPSLVIAVTMKGQPDIPQFGEWVQPYLPIAILALTLAIVSGSTSEMAIAFTPAEIDFLFPAPFGRHELLIYKLAKVFLGTIFVALMFSITFLLLLGPWFSAFIGLSLTLLFVNLVAIVVALARQIVAEHAYTFARKLVLAGVGSLAAIGFGQALLQTSVRDIPALALRFRTTITGRVILAPFEVFGHTILAPDVFPSLLGWSAAAIAIDIGLLILVFRLDIDYLEGAAAISHKLYERMRQARKGGGIALPPSKLAAKLRIPTLPWLGGAGPLAWRQLLVATRTSRFLILFAAICAAGMVVLAFFPPHGGEQSAMFLPAIGLSFMSYLTFVFSMQLPWAFRGDVDHIDSLKTLPVPSLGLAAGQLAGGVIVLTVIQFIVLFAMIVAKADPTAVVTAGAFLVPVDVLMLGVSNFLFLLYPVRFAQSNSADFQLMARVLLFMLLQFLILIPSLGIPAALGGVVFLLSNFSRPAFVATAWLTLVAELPVVVFAVAWAFERFDPSADTPA